MTGSMNAKLFCICDTCLFPRVRCEEGPFLRPATSSVLQTTRPAAAVRATVPHLYHGQRLSTKCLLNKREQEALIKSTATLGHHGDVREDTPRPMHFNDSRAVGLSATEHYLGVLLSLCTAAQL